MLFLWSLLFFFFLFFVFVFLKIIKNDFWPKSPISQAHLSPLGNWRSWGGRWQRRSQDSESSTEVVLLLLANRDFSFKEKAGAFQRERPVPEDWTSSWIWRTGTQTSGWNRVSRVNCGRRDQRGRGGRIGRWPHVPAWVPLGTFSSSVHTDEGPEARWYYWYNPPFWQRRYWLTVAERCRLG